MVGFNCGGGAFDAIEEAVLLGFPTRHNMTWTRQNLMTMLNEKFGKLPMLLVHGGEFLCQKKKAIIVLPNITPLFLFYHVLHDVCRDGLCDFWVASSLSSGLELFWQALDRPKVCLTPQSCPRGGKRDRINVIMLIQCFQPLSRLTSLLLRACGTCHSLPNEDLSQLHLPTT